MTQTNTMQDIGMENEVNLCDSCCHEAPGCGLESVVFGTGKGEDNIAACSKYEAIKFRDPKDLEIQNLVDQVTFK